MSDKSIAHLSPDLPPRQPIFVEEYVADFNGTQAAKRAGYEEKNAGCTARDILKKPQVKKVIEERAKAGQIGW